MEWNRALDQSESELPAVQQVLKYLFWTQSGIFSDCLTKRTRYFRAHLLIFCTDDTSWRVWSSSDSHSTSKCWRRFKRPSFIFFWKWRNLHNGCSIVTVLYSLRQNREIRELKCLYQSLLALKHAHTDRGLTTLMVFRTWHVNVLHRSETVDLHYWETVSSLMCSWVMPLSRLSNCYDSLCGCWH